MTTTKKLALTPTLTLRSGVRTFVYLLALTLIACGQDHDHSEEDAHEHQNEENGHEDEGHEAQKNTVLLSKSQVKNAGIEVASPKRMDLARSIRSIGKLELPPGNKAGVSPMVPGNVSDIHVIQGTHVEEGEVLATLEDPGIIDLQRDFLEDREEYRYLAKEWERVKRLYEDSVGSARELQEVRSAYKKAESRLKAGTEKLRSIGVDTAAFGDDAELQRRVPLKAPIGGVVSEVKVKRGSRAAPNEELFTILDIHHMHIDLMVYEKDLHKVKIGQNVLFDLIGRETPRPMSAEVFGIGNSFDEKEKAARVHAEIEDSVGSLFPGIYVKAWIDVDSVKSARVVPEEAVLRFEGDHYLFLDQGENDHGKQGFQRIPVRKGISERGYVEVEGLEGPLPEDGRVVVRGAPYLLRHMRKGVGGHDH